MTSWKNSLETPPSSMPCSPSNSMYSCFFRSCGFSIATISSWAEGRATRSVRGGTDGGQNHTKARAKDKIPTGQHPARDNPTGQHRTEQDPIGQDPTEQDPTGQDPTEQDPTGQHSTEQDPTGQDPKRQNPTHGRTKVRVRVLRDSQL